VSRVGFLPDGVEELLPDEAWRAEALRRRLLDHYRDQGYGLVMTPLVEHIDSLLIGAGSDLEDQTFRFVDPDSGRLLGLRADMTPQAARIAALRFPGSDPVRLCYLGTVLRTRPDTQGGARTPRQVGCELFGVPGLEGDLEALGLMLQTLALAGVRDTHVDIGHLGIYRALLSGLSLSAVDEAQLFEIMQRKSTPDFRQWAAAVGLPAQAAARLEALMGLHGSVEVLDRAPAVLGTEDAVIIDALNALRQTAEKLRLNAPEIGIHIDLTELRGYRYQTGLVFAAFVSGYGREVARGGRYDGVSAAFGSDRPATGFSADLNELLALGADWNE
jgi:ATP phosphoribosyltransferase regulatory subunit